MSFVLYRQIRPLLFALNPELAHDLALLAIRSGLLPGAKAIRPGLARRVFGIDFPNPVGLAAGFDKNADAIDGAFRLGFGFVEIGTVTPRAQAGNPKPRLYRLTADRAVINRMGFNNKGLDYVRRKLEKWRARRGTGIVGANIGANKDSEDRIADYVAGVKILGPLADYLTINISSPNTPGLRGLQDRDALTALLGAVVNERQLLPGDASAVPLLLKVAPDLEAGQCGEIAEAAVCAGINGIILTNTTLDRPAGLESRHAVESGGLSGAPLFEKSTATLAEMANALAGKLSLIGVGGIASGQDVAAKINAGASLIQLYSGLVYEGPGLVGRILDELTAIHENDMLQ